MLLRLSSAQSFEAELSVPLGLSPLLLSFSIVLHILVLSALVWMPLLWYWKLGLLGLISLLSFYEWCSQPSLGNRDFSRLIWRETGGWELLSVQGKLQAAKLMQHFSSRLLTILHLQVQGKTKVIIFLPDNLEPVPAQVLRRRLNLVVDD